MVRGEAHPKIPPLHFLFPGSIPVPHSQLLQGVGSEGLWSLQGSCSSLLVPSPAPARILVCAAVLQTKAALGWALQGLQMLGTHPLPWDAAWVSLQWLLPRAAGKRAMIILCTGCRNVHSSTGSFPSCTLFPPQCPQDCLLPHFLSAVSLFLDVFSQRHHCLCLLSQL